jgi:biotin carboxyl carrier protein
VDVSWIDGDTLSLIEGSASREVRFHRRADGLDVAFHGRIFDAVVSRAGRAAVAENGHAADSGPQVIKTPMPGRIARVLVAAGDRVTARQPVVIVEAMKMENELRSPKDGTVKEVLVAAGTAVEAGTVLLVID